MPSRSPGRDDNSGNLLRTQSVRWASSPGLHSCATRLSTSTAAGHCWMNSSQKELSSRSCAITRHALTKHSSGSHQHRERPKRVHDGIPPGSEPWSHEPASDFSQQAHRSHHWAGAVPRGRERGVDGEAALLWQEHGLHRLHHFLCDGQLIEGESLLGGRGQ